MEVAVCLSETSVNVYRINCRHIPEDSTLHSHRCENLKPNIPNVQDDSKLLSEFPFIGNGNPDNNLESPCISTPNNVNLHTAKITSN
jgi:hypothetical protein